MRHTENTITIICQECPPKEGYIVGIDNMIKHILSDHKTYTHDEAVIYANMWMEEAFQRSDEEDAEHAQQMREMRGIKNDYQTRSDREVDRQIDTDIDFQKRGI